MAPSKRAMKSAAVAAKRVKKQHVKVKGGGETVRPSKLMFPPRRKQKTRGLSSAALSSTKPMTLDEKMARFKAAGDAEVLGWAVKHDRMSNVGYDARSIVPSTWHKSHWILRYSIAVE